MLFYLVSAMTIISVIAVDTDYICTTLSFIFEPMLPNPKLFLG